MCVRARVCVCVCVRARVCACVCARACVCVYVLMYDTCFGDKSQTTHLHHSKLNESIRRDCNTQTATHRLQHRDSSTQTATHTLQHTHCNTDCNT